MVSRQSRRNGQVAAINDHVSTGGYTGLAELALSGGNDNVYCVIESVARGDWRAVKCFIVDRPAMTRPNKGREWKNNTEARQKRGRE